MRGAAVIGCAGGVGATLVTAALAMAGEGPRVRVLALDGHGGGPHVLWGLSPERSVDHLYGVRGEVDASHVDHVVHRNRSGIEVAAGPRDAVATAHWEPHVERLVAALTATGAWIADLGRGDHCIARSLITHADVVVLVTSATPTSLATCARYGEGLPAGCEVVPVMLRGRDDPLSARAGRRLLGRDVLEVPWDRGGAERCAAGGDAGTRGMWKPIAALARQVATRA